MIQEHFEALIFAELHWKKDIVRMIEELVIPDKSMSNSHNELDDTFVKPSICVRNVYYIKCKNTVDEYISRLLYRGDQTLWE